MQPPTTDGTSPVTYRRGTAADSRAVFDVFLHSVRDLLYHKGIAEQRVPDVETLDTQWQSYASLYDFLADEAEEFWIAEQGERIAGYARSIQVDGVRELTEFFVLPDVQAHGLGRGLLERAFPTEGATHRTIIATLDSRAQALYMRSGVFPRFPVHNFGRETRALPAPEGLTAVPLENGDGALDVLGAIDRKVLGYRRDATHRWLLDNRQGYLYFRGGRPLGYGYVGRLNGPFAALDGANFPALLTHAEHAAAGQDVPEFNIIVPLINEPVVTYLLANGFKMDRFFCRVMTDRPFGSFERYVLTSPMFFL